jgi:hypothetical protein
VKAVRHGDRVEDVDVRRQVVVQPLPQRLGRQRRDDVEVGDLCERVDARVGPPGSVQLEVFPLRDLADGAIDLALNRARVLLNLPAAVSRAGIFNGEFESRQRYDSSRFNQFSQAR